MELTQPVAPPKAHRGRILENETMDFDSTKIVGKTPTSIHQTTDEITFNFTDGSQCKFFHIQDCCETVEIEDVNGDWQDLIGNPLLVADERVSEDVPPRSECWDVSNTWTFYTFRGVGGSVDVRWHGSSNGYYSESVDFAFNEAT